MTGQKRKEKILAILEESGTVNVSDLAGAFSVSDKTIRRDLEALESKGLLVRFRGGAKKREADDVSTNQMKFELSEDAPVRIVDEEGTDVTEEMEASQKMEQAWVVKTSKPEWIVKAIEKNRPGTIEETQKPKKDLDIIEVGAPIKPETLAELIKLAGPESKKAMPIPSDETAGQATAKDSASLPKKRDDKRKGRPRRKARPAKPVKATGEVKASESKEPPKSKKVAESRKQKRPVTEVREDKRRTADKPTRPRKKREEREETTPKKDSKKRKVLESAQIIIALICLVAGAVIAIYVLFFAGDPGQGDGVDGGTMQELVTHRELSFYVPDNWNVLEGDGNDTVIRIRGRQGDIIGAMTVSTHEGNPDASLEANFDEISVRIHQGVTDLQSDVIQFGNTPTRRHSYTDPLGEIETSLNTFLIPSGENIKYIQLRKPIDGFNQDLLSQFNEIVRSMNFQPNEFTREQ